MHSNSKLDSVTMRHIAVFFSDNLFFGGPGRNFLSFVWPLHFQYVPKTKAD